MRRPASVLGLKTMGLGLGLVLWIIGPFVFLAVVMRTDLSGELVAREQPTVAVSESQGGAVEMVGVAMVWEAPVELYAPAWEGVVQRVDVAAGAEVGNGDPLVTVSGLTRLMAATGQPFYRPLGLNARGADARALNEWLAALGLPHGTGDTVTQTTLRGVREVASRVGVDVAKGAEVASEPAAEVAFDPAWVVFSPRDRFMVGSVDLAVGAPAPAAGSAFVTARPVLSSAVVVDADTAKERASQAEMAEQGGGDAGGGDDAGGPGAGGGPAAPDALPAGMPVPVSRAVFVDEAAEVPLALGEDRMTVTPEGLGALVQVVEPGAVAKELMSRSVKVDGGLQVPATAVVVGEDGSFCVVDSDQRPHPIEVTDSGGGSVSFLVVGGGVASGTRVLDRPPPSVGCAR